MSYYRYITGVYKSYLPGLNRTLRSSSVPRTVLPLDTSEFSTIKDNRINLTYWSKELDRWLVSLDNKVVSHLKIGPFQKSLINNHFQHLQFHQRWFFFFLFVVFSSLEQVHLSLFKLSSKFEQRRFFQFSSSSFFQASNRRARLLTHVFGRIPSVTGIPESPDTNEKLGRKRKMARAS